MFRGNVCVTNFEGSQNIVEKFLCLLGDNLRHRLTDDGQKSHAMASADRVKQS